MHNGSPIGHIEQDTQIAEYDQHLQAHITLLETAIENSNDPKEREKGYAAIRRLKAGIGDLKK